MLPARRGLEERLAAGETILCAEGYLVAFSRSAYVAPGLWASDFVLDYPEVVREKHYEFVRAGSDVTEAYQVGSAATCGYGQVPSAHTTCVFGGVLQDNAIVSFTLMQYYTHRKRMGMVGKADETEHINRVALKIAREVAEDTGTLLAGGISNTDLFKLGEMEDPSGVIREMFEEQVRWSKEEGVDYVIAETISDFKEAKIALEVIKSFDLPAVVTFAVTDVLARKDGEYVTCDGVPVSEACHKLLDMGATLVGVNCSLGPSTMISVVEQICQKVPPEKVCALPVTFRTTEEAPAWHLLVDKTCPENNPVYPNGLDAFYVSPVEIVQFTKRCLELGMRYIGICCGNTGNYTRVMAEAMGREPPCNKYHSETALAKAREETKKKRSLLAKRAES